MTKTHDDDYLEPGPEIYYRLIVLCLQFTDETRELGLDALRLEAEASGTPENCSHRKCRTSGKCRAKHFDGFRHPCGIPWQLETIRAMMQMIIFHANQLEKNLEPTQFNWWPNLSPDAP